MFIANRAREASRVGRTPAPGLPSAPRRGRAPGADLGFAQRARARGSKSARPAPPLEPEPGAEAKTPPQGSAEKQERQGGGKGSQGHPGLSAPSGGGPGARKVLGVQRAPWVPERQWTGTALCPGDRPGTGSPVPQGCLPAEGSSARGPTMVRTEAGPRPSPRPSRRVGVRVSCRPSRGSSHSPSCSPVSQSSGWLRSESPSQIAKTLSGVRVKARELRKAGFKGWLGQGQHAQGPALPPFCKGDMQGLWGFREVFLEEEGGRPALRAGAPAWNGKVQPKGLLRAEGPIDTAEVSPPRRVMRDGSPAPVSVPSVAPWRKVSRHWTASSVPRRRRWSRPMTLALLIREERARQQSSGENLGS